MHPDNLTQQVAPLFLQQVAPFFRTQTTTTDRQTSLLVESDGHVLGELHAAYPRVRRHSYSASSGNPCLENGGEVRDSL